MTDKGIGKQPIDDLTPDEIVRFSLMGLMRFDAVAVADALRNGRISPLGLISLAKMIDGTHSMGLRLVLKGQGKGWRSMHDNAKHYERVMSIGEFVDRRLIDVATVEEAVMDAAEHFQLSEPTIYRDLRLYRNAHS